MAIANADGSIVLTTKVDQSGLKKGMSTMKSGVSSLIGSFGKLASAIGIAFSVGAIIEFSKEASKLATTTEASVQRLIDIYGSASQAVGDFIDANAQALGMSKAAAASYASVYGNLFSVWADQQTNAALTTQYLQMTAVVASKTGRTVEDVQERIRSGLLGNTEAIEDLGIFVNVKTIEMTDAFKRMADGKSWEQLDAYTQQQIRSMAILEQATTKYGDEVASTTALTKAQFQAAWQDFQATWGQVVNRVLMPVLEVLTDILVSATAVMQALFNISGDTISQGDAISDAADHQEELTDAVKETEEATKKALAGFDDIQILNSETMKESGEVQKPDLDVEAAPSNPIDTSKYEEFATNVKVVFEDIKKYIENLWKKIDIDIAPIQGAFEFLKENVFADFLSYLFEDFSPTVAETIGQAINYVETIFTELGAPLSQAWNEGIAPIFADMGATILDLIEGIGDIFDHVSEQISLHQEEITMVIEVISGVIQLLWAIIQPIIQAIVDNFLGARKNTIDLIFDIINSIGEFLSAWKDVINGVVELLKGNTEDAKSYIEEALGHFANMWISIANTIINVINRLWEGIFNGFKKAVNAVADVINKVADFFGWDLNLQWNATAPLIPEIEEYVPKLAKGAVIPANREFLAVLGDQKHGTNIEAPLQTIVDAFNIALQGNANYGGGNTEVVLEIDGREFGRAVVEQGNRENRRIGTRLVIA